MGTRRALVTPQNTFVESITRILHASECSFVLGNARIADYPIVYASERFTQMTGYSKIELTQQPSTLIFMFSEDTDCQVKSKLQQAFDKQETYQAEMRMLSKKRTSLWLSFRMVPVKNEKNDTVLFLCVLQDITSQRKPANEEDGSQGITKFARLVRNATRASKIESTPTYQNTDVSNNEKTNNSESLSQLLDNIPQYRNEAPKAAPHILLHYSRFKAGWDWVILMLTLYTSVMVPYYFAFKYKTLDDVPVIVTNSLVDVVFFVDLVLNFHTTFVGRAGDVVADPKIIGIAYLRTWFTVDLLSCLPYDLFNAFQYSDTNTSSALNAVKVIRLLRLGRVARKLDHYIEYGAALLVLIVCVFAVIGHWFACAWYLIGRSEASVYRYNWLNALANLTGNAYYTTNGSDALYGGPTRMSSYITALYFTLSCMTSVGFGNVNAATDMEKLFACCMMIGGALLYASIFGNITAIMQQFMTSSSKYRDILNSVKQFVKLYQVPRELSLRISDYVVSLWVVTKGIDHNHILDYCPKDIKADVCVHLHRKILKEHPGFRLASDGCLRALALHFTIVHSAPGDLLYHKGESIDQLCFVISGSLEVVQDEELVAILSNGDTFGDDFWNQDAAAQSVASVRALTYCSIHCIKRYKLLEVLHLYQAFSNAFRRNMTITYSLRNRLLFRKVKELMEEKELDKVYGEDSNAQLARSSLLRKLFSRLTKSASGTQAVNTPSLDEASERADETGVHHESSTEPVTRLEKKRIGWEKFRPGAGANSAPETGRSNHAFAIEPSCKQSESVCAPSQATKEVAGTSEINVTASLLHFAEIIQLELAALTLKLTDIEHKVQLFSLPDAGAFSLRHSSSSEVSTAHILLEGGLLGNDESPLAVAAATYASDGNHLSASNACIGDGEAHQTSRRSSPVKGQRTSAHQPSLPTSRQDTSGNGSELLQMHRINVASGNSEPQRRKWNETDLDLL